MYKLIKQNNQFQNAQNEYICDVLTDLNGVEVPFGSKAYCITESAWYMFNGSNQWIKISSSPAEVTPESDPGISQTEPNIIK